MPNPTLKVVVVEDNPGDRKLLQSLSAYSTRKWNIEFLTDGEKAAHYFSGRGREKEALPDLILVDINMPRIDGWELLRRLKISHRFRSVPALVLTTSTAERDMEKARFYDVALLTKPQNLSELTTLVERIEWVWKRAQQQG